MPRRIVTGLDADGRSNLLVDEPVAFRNEGSARYGLAWRTETLPAPDSGAVDMGAQPFSLSMLRHPGCNFMLCEMAVQDGSEPPMMHSSDNGIDLIIVLRGSLELIVETGATVLGSGDVVVERGSPHAWRALGPEPALIALVTLPAEGQSGGHGA